MSNISPEKKQKMESRIHPEVQLSTSVDDAISRFGANQKISSWDLIQAILDLHVKDYGKGRGASFLGSTGPSDKPLRTVLDWVLALRQIINIKNVRIFDGRMLIIGLCRLDPELERYLGSNGFLDELIKELELPVKDIFLESPANKPAILISDPTPLHIDNPTDIDRLGREGFVHALAIRLILVWREFSQSKVHGSFALHLHGPWGAGKTSLLKLLELSLQSKSPRIASIQPSNSQRDATSSESLQWVVVDFNGWQYQRLDPPWWFLMDAVYRQARRQLHDTFHQRWLAIRLWLYETVWRIFIGRLDIITAFAIALLLAGLLYWPFRPIVLRLLSGSKAQDVSDIFSVASIILSAVLIVSRSLLSGSARAAQTFVQSRADPMERVVKHFHGLVTIIKRPIIIFIDDLDRCQSNYVVNLLEGIQTLFYDPRVIYLVAADRRWLYSCFETHYQQFASAVNDPGRRLGSLFLEKAFELSISVPQISSEWQKKYWRDLVVGSPLDAVQNIDEYERKARTEFEQAVSESQVITLLSRIDENPVSQQARRKAAIERLANAQIEKSTRYFLEQFAQLLESNPRSMKRLLNAYSMHRDFALLSGVNVLTETDMRKRLALWTILCQRWPSLEEYYCTLAIGGEVRSDAEINTLLDSKAVKEVLDGNGVGVKLDLNAIRTLMCV